MSSALQAIDRHDAFDATARSVDVDADVRSLTSAIAAGDAAAFSRFFDGWFDAMHAEAARCTGRDQTFRLDVVQEAMMRVIRSMKPMDSAEHLRAWLRAVVRASAYDLLRREARLRRRERRAAGGPGGAGHDADLDARLDWLRRELLRLDQVDAHLLLLRYGLGWTLKRIGNAINATPGAVDGRLRRLLAAMRLRGGEDRRG